MAFLNFYLLSALALASVPIIIHLLNRRRFQIVDWAPMKYLKLTIKANRKRLRIEQLILLALRTLAIILLVLAVARPLLSKNAGAQWLPGRQRTSHVVLIDNSLSMAYLAEGRPAFDLAKEAARTLFASYGTQDSLTLVTSARPDKLLLNESTADPAKIADAFKSIQQTDTKTDWAATFQSLDRTLGSTTFPNKEIVLITDLRKSGWADLSEISNKWSAADVKLRVIDVGSQSTDNVSLLALEQEDPIALPGEAVRLRLRLQNNSAATISGANATLTLGDESNPQGSRPLVLPDLPIGSPVEVHFTATSPKPGPFPVKVTLPTDALNADNSRTLLLNFRSTLDLALVDGEPKSQPFESETDFLTLAFTLGNNPWKPSKQTEPEWLAAKSPATADVYILANVANPSPQRIAELESLVRRGAGLIVFVGDQLELNTYNSKLFNNGAGLLPAQLAGVIDAPATGLVIEPLAQSPLEPMAKLAPAALARVQTKKYMSVQLPQKTEGLRILARWNNSESSPAILEKQFGRGKVLLVTTPADKAWGDWPLDPTYVLAMRSAVAGLVRDDSAKVNFTAGQPLRWSLDFGAIAQQPSVLMPNSETQSASVIESSNNSPATLQFDQTDLAGLYRLSWKNAQSQSLSQTLAVTPDKSESDLARLSESDLQSFTGSLNPSILRYTGESSLTDRGREIWRALALVTLILFVTEMVFATYVGRQH